MPDPKSLGDHLRNRRVVLRVSQKLAASDLGVSPFTLLNWEKGHTEPPIGRMPRILRWLAYNPFPEPRALPERMLAARRATGWTIVEAAKRFGVDSATWGDWERTGRVPRKRYKRRLDSFLASTSGK